MHEDWDCPGEFADLIRRTRAAGKDGYSITSDKAVS
jgi:hypothetical protein